MSSIGKEPSFNRLATLSGVDSSTGEDVTLATPATRTIRLTGFPLVSIAGIPATRNGDQIVLQNDTGFNLLILNDSSAASAGNRIKTGFKANRILKDEGSCIFEYSSSESAWMAREFLEAPVYVSYTGGSTATDGDYNVATFTSSGTFSISNTSTANFPWIDYLVIAGGGGGGSTAGGGGGAGGYREFENAILAIGTASHAVTVGGGGSGVNGTRGTSGSDSAFTPNGTVVTSNGGGGGGGDANTTGISGGSGGGAGNNGVNGGGTGGAGNTPSTSPSQGNNGGNGALSRLGGGGGGANAVGTNASGTTAGSGGAGRASSITGSSVTRAGGGGASCVSSGTAGTGGAGGGGNGGDGGAGVAGTANTGGGGGGGYLTAGAGGGSGVVIIRLRRQ